LTPNLRCLLEHIQNTHGELIALQITATGGYAAFLLNTLLRVGYVTARDRPRLIDRHTGSSVATLVITPTGEAASSNAPKSNPSQW
jgi:hypothetical protein